MVKQKWRSEVETKSDRNLEFIHFGIILCRLFGHPKLTATAIGHRKFGPNLQLHDLYTLPTCRNQRRNPWGQPRQRPPVHEMNWWENWSPELMRLDLDLSPSLSPEKMTSKFRTHVLTPNKLPKKHQKKGDLAKGSHDRRVMLPKSRRDLNFQRRLNEMVTTFELGLTARNMELYSEPSMLKHRTAFQRCWGSTVMSMASCWSCKMNQMRCGSKKLCVAGCC